MTPDEIRATFYRTEFIYPDVSSVSQRRGVKVKDLPLERIAQELEIDGGCIWAEMDGNHYQTSWDKRRKEYLSYATQVIFEKRIGNLIDGLRIKIGDYENQPKPEGEVAVGGDGLPYEDGIKVEITYKGNGQLALLEINKVMIERIGPAIDSVRNMIAL